MSQSDREKWDARWNEGPPNMDPSPFLVGLDVPRHGRALDVAGGAGRHAIWLATRGLDVTLADISEVALAHARDAAAASGLRLSTLATDLEVDPLPPGPWDLIVSFHFLRRPLFADFPRVLAPGGQLVYVQPTRSNLERHARPPAGFLLEDGELRGLVRGLEIVLYEEGWLNEGRHEARMVARKRRPQSRP